jgi:flagellar motor switch protein FliM
MERILSQDEINALFSSMASGNSLLSGTKESAGEARASAVRYDFARSDRIAKDQIRSLQLLHSLFARSLSSSLSAYLRIITEVSLESIDQLSYGEFLKRVSDPTLYCLLSLKPMRGSVAMEIAPALVFPMIDILLGGSGAPPAEARPLTEIEIKIMEGVIRLILRDLKEAWRPVSEIDPHLESTETKPQMLRILAPGEAVVVPEFQCRFGQNTGAIRLCLPSMMLKMNRSKFDQHGRSPSAEGEGREQQRARETVRSASVALGAEMHDRNLLVEDLLSVGVGDIIQLNRTVGDPSLLCISGVPKFKGRIVACRGKKAFEITEQLEP